MPAPKLFTSFPVESNFNTDGRSDILPVVRSRHELPVGVCGPQRSATQIDLPSLSTSTALVDPHVRPSGSLAHPRCSDRDWEASLVGLA
jgi:hypothetical protein